LNYPANGGGRRSSRRLHIDKLTTVSRQLYQGAAGGLKLILSNTKQQSTVIDTRRRWNDMSDVSTDNEAEHQWRMMKRIPPSSCELLIKQMVIIRNQGDININNKQWKLFEALGIVR